MLRSLPHQTHPLKSLSYIDDGPKKTSHQRCVIQMKSNRRCSGHNPSTNERSTACHRGHKLLIVIRAHHWSPITTTAQRSVPLNALQDERAYEGTTGAIRPRMRMDCSRPREHQEQERLRLLNQHLLAQVTALQNNPVQSEGDPENNRSPNLRTLDELIQKRIEVARMLGTQIAKIYESPSQRRSKSASSQRSSPIQHLITIPG